MGKSKRVSVSAVLLLAFGIVLSALAYNDSSGEQKYEHAEVTEEEQKEKLREAVNEINETIENELPGIICWGDSLTRGWDASYPATLSELIQENIIDQIPLEAVIDSDYAYLLDNERYAINPPEVVNMGVACENSITIAGRAGGIPYVTSEEIVIPAQITPIKLPFISADGKAVVPYDPGHCGLEEIKISGGGYGTLSVKIDESTKERTYYFTRKTPGESVEIPAGTEIETYGATHYLDYLPVIYIGTNGGYNDPGDLIRQQRSIINRYVKNKEHFIIIGIHTGTRDEREELEEAMEREYGDQYINLREYMSTRGIDDSNELLNAGIKVSDHDKEMIAEGQTPASLMKEDELHFNAYGYQLIGNLIYCRMEKLGYFDEVQNSIDEIIRKSL